MTPKEWGTFVDVRVGETENRVLLTRGNDLRDHKQGNSFGIIQGEDSADTEHGELTTREQDGHFDGVFAGEEGSEKQRRETADRGNEHHIRYLAL